MASLVSGNRMLSLTFWMLLFALALSNVLLIRQNRRMRAELNELKPKMLGAGDKAVAFIAPGMRGEVSVNYTGYGPKRVFIYLSPDCQYCGTQFPYWRQLLNRVDRNRFTVVGLVSETEERGRVFEYLHTFDCDHLETAFVSNSVLRNYKLSITPTTLVVDSNGTVEKAWAGVWDANTLAAAGSVFGLAFESN